MDRACWLVLMIFLTKCASGSGSENGQIKQENAKEDSVSTQSWRGSLTMYPTVAAWSLQTTIPFASHNSVSALIEKSDDEGRGGKKSGLKKKMKKYMMPLLIAYKLKFFTLIPVMIGGLILLTGATGLAGFFFALFAAVMGLKSGHQEH
ncbi:uncharacterized protein LOC125504608 [Dendroctonus ponderosae]|uniref:uncharacterized protein LOC125504608 n=1 Tax=Dendroctonus ponderosae TaxID=77166 RepID=UPI002035DC08|nr:uncharacterized protein LOC125504608 [Dendroctonus ponderosae]KAH1009423.1 hypothetical protein HUJ04_001782 [Dendroctonus ponderosae]KAH1009424.1 hypothetical protein HUJ04_001782 [Dendroctonus ponderosae]KAH1017412.1 hypothetical protein HUJ05_008057 [Dendroctonus ponderosae]KAH1017413.1 hypothetical protein HUJ05_008057 [Dendroctonus ponderosae]